MASFIRSRAKASTSLDRVSSISTTGAGRFGRPAASLSLTCRSIIGCRDSWPKNMASSISSSLTKSPPPSTMTTASLLPATIRLISLSVCSSRVGLILKSPFMRPTRTQAIGPAKGVLDISRAAEAPVTAKMSGSFSLSTESTVAIT